MKSANEKEALKKFALIKMHLEGIKSLVNFSNRTARISIISSAINIIDTTIDNVFVDLDQCDEDHLKEILK